MKKITLLFLLTLIFLTISTVQAAEINVNQDNYMNYLTDDNLDNGDILNFESDTNLNNNNIEIKKNITITSNPNVQLSNMVIILDEGSTGSIIKNLNIRNSNNAIEVYSNDITITGNTITIESETEDITAILIDGSENTKIYQNTINTNTKGELTTIDIVNCKNIELKENTINTKCVEKEAKWTELNGDYSTIGVHIKDTENPILSKNNIKTESTELIDEEFGTIVGVCIENSPNSQIKDNNIETKALKYAYNLILLSNKNDKVDVENNNLTSNSKYYANSINPQKVSGTIKNNNIKAIADYVSYPYYATLIVEKIELKNNDIYGEGEYVYGVEIYNGNKTQIEENTINVKGDYSLAIAIASRSTGNTINKNTINTIGSKEGEKQCGDSILAENTGIKIVYESNNNLITNNKITTQGKYSINLEDTNNTLSGNELKSSLGTGNATIKDKNTNTTKPNKTDPPTPPAPENKTDKNDTNITEELILIVPNARGEIGTNLTLEIKVTTTSNTTINTGRLITQFNNQTQITNIQNSIVNITVTLPQIKGNYTFTAIYMNNSYTKTNTSTIEVYSDKITTTIESENLNFVYGDKKDLTGILKAEDGSPIIGQHVKINLTRTSSGANKVYDVVTDYKGEYKLEINLAPGQYTANAKYEGINNYSNAESDNTITINKKEGTATKIEIDDFDGNDLIGTLKTSDNQAIIGHHVTVKLTRLSSGANKVYDTVTDYQSIFSLPINLAKGQYSALCSYDGILDYTDSSASLVFQVE